ncbi:glucose-6-phosphate dehydrogenase [Solimonas sp. K1W22B-7]|uniref:glucose-6-phosphate dehydrogenase n=1 Tax=Solimonas sp. K1W22B-7 TaxID=2303331 RepID=UPI000E331824|nr:glucose-6-phosphate dehydrogenase [Solimonas sp. K1W22B-7]AXQ29398.1 glucose-6-phosphate dehydrogenase [Solimonas sp. K1W22B-7]
MTPQDSFDLVIFGGSGDLSMRKLLPALYHRHRDTRDTSGWRILAIGRQALTREQFLAVAQERGRRHIAAADFSDSAWAAFAERLDYISMDCAAAADYTHLVKRLGSTGERVRVFYMATTPTLFSTICGNLGKAGLVTPQSRVVLEKPLGRDLASAARINGEVGAVFAEHQIFRIDHYLGKEAVQNLIALRFGNVLFESLWNRNCIRDVQITIAETVGVEDRGEFYDGIGALRDMMQNHLLQLLCIVAMEPPTSIDADAMRDEKLKVLRALRPMSAKDVAAQTVRGQYRAGAVGGAAVPGYLEEEGIPAGSETETFVAIKAQVDNWRWAGVPFYLRTGKRMQERLAQIVVTFRDVPHALLPVSTSGSPCNRLVITLQPDEGLKLNIMAKVPGEAMALRPVSLDLSFTRTYRGRQWEAYERLLMDAVHGKLTLFVRRDEVDAAWRWVEPILGAWATQGAPLKQYPAGSWGPVSSNALIVREGHTWHEES